MMAPTHADAGARAHVVADAGDREQDEQREHQEQQDHGEPLLPARVAELAEPDPQRVEHAGLRLASRCAGWYMKRQMIPAPTNEMAIGRKISDLATFSPFERSASTATASPNDVERAVTTMTHHRLLNDRAAQRGEHEHDNRKKPNISGPKAPPDESKARPRAAAGDDAGDHAQPDQRPPPSRTAWSAEERCPSPSATCSRTPCRRRPA